MKLFLKPTSDELFNVYKGHTHYNPGDSGIDLFIPEDIIIKGGETVIIDLGVKCEAINDNGNGCSYYLYPRSSICRTPLRLSNSVGIIDRGYRGNIKAAFDNIKGDTFKINKGERLVQICAPDLSPIVLSVTDTLSEPEGRGEGGFGSTGL